MVSLQNFQVTCPELSNYLINTYRQPSTLHIADETLESQEGTTQGDPAAMGFYAISTIPLIEELKLSDIIQVWFADDATAAGSIEGINNFWQRLVEIGPSFGYFPHPEKTTLIVKPEFVEKAHEVFGSSGVTIDSEGKRHLGAVIGTKSFKEKFVTNLVKDWTDQLDTLCNIAKIDPHVAYAGFITGFCNKWRYFQRTIPETASFYQPLEDKIKNTFIPALIGRPCTESERILLSFPCRLGGLGIENPVETADRNFKDSEHITKPFVSEIRSQGIHNDDNKNLDEKLAHIREEMKERKLTRKKDGSEVLEGVYKEFLKTLTEDLQRSIQLNSEKGASVWLTSLPLSDQGFNLNAQEFRDAICLRYGWKVNNIAPYCECGSENNINHSLICKKGGFISLRHNELRDIEAELISEVCKDVTVEPPLLPCDGYGLGQSTNTDRDARLDFSARGFWSPLQRAFFDVRVFHPNSPSYLNRSPNALYAVHENQKKAAYNERVLNVEHGTFTPLIFSTTGGMGKENTKYHKRLAGLIALKRNEDYPTVISYLRKKIRFALLRTTLIAIRGTRTSAKRCYYRKKMADTDINLIEALNY